MSHTMGKSDMFDPETISYERVDTRTVAGR